MDNVRGFRAQPPDLQPSCALRSRSVRLLMLRTCKACLFAAYSFISSFTTGDTHCLQGPEITTPWKRINHQPAYSVRRVPFDGVGYDPAKLIEKRLKLQEELQPPYRESLARATYQNSVSKMLSTDCGQKAAMARTGAGTGGMLGGFAHRAG